MKSFGLFCLCLAWTVVAHAELDTVWTRQIQLSDAGNAIDGAIVLQNGETLLSSSHFNGGIVDLWRVSQSGDIVWQGSATVPAQFASILGLVQLDEGHVVMVCAFQDQADPGPTLYLKSVNLTGTELWERSYLFEGLNWEGGVRKLAGNTFAVYLSTYSPVEASRGRLIKFESDGDSLWSRMIGPDAVDVQARDLAEAPNGDLILVGQFTSESFFMAGYIQRVSNTGNPIWTRTYNDDTQFGLGCTCVDVTTSGDIIAGGQLGNFWWFNRPWGVSLAANGDENWQLTGLPDEDCSVLGVRALSDGGATMVGTTQPSFGFNQAKVISVDAGGVGNVEHTIDGQISYFSGMSPAGTRGAVAYGALNVDGMLNNGLVMRFGPGTILTGFVREQGSNQPIENARVELIETGEFAVTDVQGIYMLGLSQASGTLRVGSPCMESIEQTVTLTEGEENVLNFSAGVPIYQNGVSSLSMIATFGIPEHRTLEISNFGNGDLHFTTSVHEQTPIYGWLSAAPVSGIVAPGESALITVTVTASAEHPTADLFGEVRVHHNSCPDTVNEVGVFTLALDSPDESPIVELFAVHPAYPNPFNNTARVAFDLPQAAQVSAKLYSIDGREAGTLIDAQYTAGRHELAISGEALATGMYLLQLTAGSAVGRQKLVLLK